MGAVNKVAKDPASQPERSINIHAMAPIPHSSVDYSPIRHGETLELDCMPAQREQIGQGADKRRRQGQAPVLTKPPESPAQLDVNPLVRDGKEEESVITFLS